MRASEERSGRGADPHRRRLARACSTRRAPRASRSAWSVPAAACTRVTSRSSDALGRGQRHHRHVLGWRAGRPVVVAVRVPRSPTSATPATTGRSPRRPGATSCSRPPATCCSPSRRRPPSRCRRSRRAFAQLEDPAHLDLIALAMCKLWNMFGPCRNYFGEKDWQQLVMFVRLADDLEFPVEVLGCPTIREDDGVAVSSRNSQLTPEQRAVAPVLYQRAVREPRRRARGRHHRGEGRAGVHRRRRRRRRRSSTSRWSTVRP